MYEASIDMEVTRREVEQFQPLGRSADVRYGQCQSDRAGLASGSSYSLVDSTFHEHRSTDAVAVAVCGPALLQRVVSLCVEGEGKET